MNTALRIKPTNALVGDVFGQLIVINDNEGYHIQTSGHRRRMVKVRCSCGDEYILMASSLISGSSTRCFQCASVSKRTCSIGEKYDRLLVIGYTEAKKSGERLVICVCDCGNEDFVFRRSAVLHNNTTNNCGCVCRRGWIGFEELSGTYMGRIRDSAMDRNLKFDVSAEQLWRLYEQQEGKCALSGIPIGFSNRTRKPNTASLDRIDNSKGYTIDNVQWVHKRVNLMKNDMTDEELIKFCRLITKYNRGK